MTGKRNLALILCVFLSSGLLASSLTAVLMARYYQKAHFEQLEGICGEIIRRFPKSQQQVAEVLKEYKGFSIGNVQGNLLSAWGYAAEDFSVFGGRWGFLSAGAVFVSGLCLYLVTFWKKEQGQRRRIEALARELEQINHGNARLLTGAGEDEFSGLQDEIYKTVTELYYTRDAALNTRNQFAENLSNIAHQMKTPLTAISLSVQMMDGEANGAYTKQIRKQLSRLTHLEEALLILARMDAGTLMLDKKTADIFTILTLAAENLEELQEQTGVSIEIPESGTVEIFADMDWMMEAVMNLMKNCMEHTGRGGKVHCSYEENLLYARICIWDEGEGFAKEDMPHLFQRFYRGRNASEEGIGIGLALAKEIVERQNGTLQAENRMEGGACFEIRFYHGGSDAGKIRSSRFI